MYYIHTYICILCVFTEREENRNCFPIFATKDGKIKDSFTVKT